MAELNSGMKILFQLLFLHKKPPQNLVAQMILFTMLKEFVDQELGQGTIKMACRFHNI